MFREGGNFDIRVVLLPEGIVIRHESQKITLSVDHASYMRI